MLKVPVRGSMVLLRQPAVSYDRQEAARRLAALAEVPVFDALNLLAHHRSGILADSLDPAVASAFAEQLQAMELPAVALHYDELIVPHVLQHVSRLDFSPDFLTVAMEAEGSVVLSWSAVLVVAVGMIVMEHDEGGLFSVSSGVTHTMRGAPVFDTPVAQSTTSERTLMLELYTSNHGQAVSVNAKKLAYTHLGERMQSNSTDNMRLTVKEVLEYAHGAVRNANVEKFITGSQLSELRYPSLQTFQDENLWLLQACHQGWLGGSSGPNNRFAAVEI